MWVLATTAIWARTMRHDEFRICARRANLVKRHDDRRDRFRVKPDHIPVGGKPKYNMLLWACVICANIKKILSDGKRVLGCLMHDKNAPGKN